MTHSRLQMVSNIAANIIGTLAVKGFDLLVVFLLARHFSVAQFGIFSFAFYTVGLFAVLMDLGINFILIREIAANPQQGNRLMGAAIPLRLFLAFAIMAGIMGLALISDYPFDTKIALLIVSTGLLFSSRIPSFADVFKAPLIATLTMKTIAGVDVVSRVLGLLAVSIALGMKLKFLWVLAAYVGSSLPVPFIYMRLARPICPIRWTVDVSLWWSLLQKGFPLAMAGILNQAISQVDILLLSRFHPAEQIGFYSAARRLIEPLELLSISVMYSILPVMAKQRPDQDQSNATLLDDAFRYLLLIQIPILIGMGVWHENILHLLYGAEYTVAGSALLLLLPYLPFMGLWQITSGHLIAAGHYKQIAVILVAGLVLNIAVNFLLIPDWSYRGAAVAKTGTTIGLALIGLVISRKKNLNRTLGVVVRGAVALAFSAQTAYLLRNHPLIAVPAFLCIMGLSCLLLKLVTRQDYLRLKSLINVRPPCESP